MKYTVTKIESKPRRLLKAMTHGLRGNVNEITIYMNKRNSFLGISWTTKYVAEGIVDSDVDINSYLKVGDSLDTSEYPMLKISKV